MRKLLGTVAVMLAVAAFVPVSLDGDWDSHGDHTAQSLSAFDHATPAASLDPIVDQNEERSRG